MRIRHHFLFYCCTNPSLLHCFLLPFFSWLRRSSDIAATYGKWRAKNKLPALRGSGNVATISGEKAKIRQIIENRGEEPLPEMKRGGMVYPGRQSAPQPRQNGRGARSSAAPTAGIEAQPLPETKRAGNKRASRRPDFFASP